MLTINDLPDDDLLTIFDFCVVGYQDLELMDMLWSHKYTTTEIRSWQSLIHVCRRWRGLVFGSPRRLNLQPGCTTRTPTRETLDVWPALPLLILGDVDETTVDNVIAELEHSDRICQINLRCHATSQIEKLWTAMHMPFPELAVLSLRGFPHEGLSYVPVLPDSFLGGSTPRLRYFYMDAIPFPGLPNLLLSATHLVNLWLYNIPHSGYISPDAMVTCLSVLTSLESLRLLFESPQSCPDQESWHLPPTTRSVLPALTRLSFKGVNEYLEELVARIDAPRLRSMGTTFFNDIYFDTPELIQFITLTFEAPKDLHVIFGSHIGCVTSWTTGISRRRCQRGNLMQGARLAALVPGTDLHLVFTSPFHDGEPLHPRAFSITTRLERWYREHRVDETFTSIYGREGSPPIQAICATYCARPTRAQWGKKNRSVAHLAEYFFGGVPAIGTSS